VCPNIHLYPLYPTRSRPETRAPRASSSATPRARDMAVATPARGRSGLSSSTSTGSVTSSEKRAARTRRRAIRCALIGFVIAIIVSRRARARADDASSFGDGTGGFGSWASLRGADSSSAPPPPPPPTTFTMESKRTTRGVDGGPKEYGNAHPLDCGASGVMTKFSFEFDDESRGVHNAYECAVAANGGPTGADAMPPPRDKATAYGPSGSHSSGRNAMWDLDQHVVDCGDQFLRKWMLRQWSSSMQISYGCAWRTGDADACEVKRTEEVPRSKKVSGWAGVELACPAEKFLSAFNYANNTFSYKCCPRPY